MYRSCQCIIVVNVPYQYLTSLIGHVTKTPTAHLPSGWLADKTAKTVVAGQTVAWQSFG